MTKFRVQNTSRSPPLGQDGSPAGESKPQGHQMIPSQFTQFPGQMDINLHQPPADFSGQIYGQPQAEEKAPEDHSADNAHLFFSDPQFLGDKNGLSATQAQVDPSPTAENLVPHFINEENLEDSSGLGKLKFINFFGKFESSALFRTFRKPL